MEREKLIWAGFGIVSLMSFVYFHRPSPPKLSSRERRVARPSKVEGHGGSKQRQLQAPTPTKQLGGIDRSRSSVTSRREKSSIQINASSNTLRVRFRDGASRVPSENEPTTVKKLDVVRTPDSDQKNVQPYVKHKVNPQRLKDLLVPQEKNIKRTLERATQTDEFFLGEPCRPYPISSEPVDVLGCISPIPSKYNDLASPLSSAGVFLSPFGHPRGGDNPLLPPALERGVEEELKLLVADVWRSSESRKTWFNLYKFLRSLPQSVLRYVVVKKNRVGLPSLSPVATPILSDEVDNFDSLQQEVYSLLRGESQRGAHDGQFTMAKNESAILWSPRGGSKSGKGGRFAHISLQSSDDEKCPQAKSMGNNNDVSLGDDAASGFGDDEDDDKCRVAERVEQILLAARQERMCSFAAQFPEGSVLQLEEKQQPQIDVATAFEEDEVMTLLTRLVKLRQHVTLDVLQHSAFDTSFSVSIADAINDAQRLLDRAVIRMATRHARSEVRTVVHETCHTPPEVCCTSHGMCTDLQQQSQEKENSKGKVLVCGDDHVTKKTTCCTSRCEKNKALTTSKRNETPDAFVRLLTTSTIPSALLEEGEQVKKSFCRSQTEAVIESISGQNSMVSAGLTSSQRRAVYERLYTPPKGVPRVSSRAIPPTSGRSKAPFNVYV